MVIIYQHTQARTGKLFIKVHYFKNGLYKYSSETFPRDEKILKALLKGHKRYALTNVTHKHELEFRQYEVNP